MIEIILLLVILTLCGLIGWMEYQNRKERSKLFNAILSKNVNDFKDLEIADKTHIDIKPLKNPDTIPMEGLTDEDWFQTEIEGKKIR
jgi:hypothetical protein